MKIKLLCIKDYITYNNEHLFIDGNIYTMILEEGRYKVIYGEKGTFFNDSLDNYFTVYKPLISKLKSIKTATKYSLEDLAIYFGNDVENDNIINSYVWHQYLTTTDYKKYCKNTNKRLEYKRDIKHILGL